MDVPDQCGEQREPAAARKTEPAPDVKQVFAALDLLERFFRDRGSGWACRAVDCVVALRRMATAVSPEAEPLLADTSKATLAGEVEAGNLKPERGEGLGPTDPGICLSGAADQPDHEGDTAGGVRAW